MAVVAGRLTALSEEPERFTDCRHRGDDGVVNGQTRGGVTARLYAG